MNSTTVITSQLTEYLHTYASHGYFNGSVLVAHQGNILLADGYGMANMEHDVPNTSKTKFRIASITKPITATVIFRLMEQGLLSLTDRLATYFPDFPHADEITIHHLLSHTSGIPNYTARPDFWDSIMRLPATREKMLAQMTEYPLDFQPGERYNYSNSGYMLLSYIIEDITGLTYPQAVKQFVTDPLGMHDTGVDDGYVLLKNRATGYGVDGGIVHAPTTDMSVTYGAYGMYSTVEDLHRFAQALSRGTLLGPESFEQMTTIVQEDYACGWAVHEFDTPHYGRQKRLCHYGDICGFCVDLLIYPEIELIVVVLSNIGVTPTVKFSRDLSKLILDVEVEMPEMKRSVEETAGMVMSEEELMPFLGIYQIEGTDRTVEISLVAGVTDEQRERSETVSSNRPSDDIKPTSPGIPHLLITKQNQYGGVDRYHLTITGILADTVQAVTHHIWEKVCFTRASDGNVTALTYEDVYGIKWTAQRK
ncbi:serine hydrolase domain-containing protein [Brevibacillus dissolubilis]|uniref:serine hydrolase domain-containing protein n=1 Tax=Brevibacillus dissolubilis TaxID=1844116 RepID=UPI0011166D88|nr:serine hydrolase domain-containing protein [Brevibacillus dissolubilis]